MTPAAGGPDDPDEATLWAGRLRAWPTADDASVDAGDDEADAGETRIARRSAFVDDTQIARRTASVDGVGAPLGEALDETIVRPRTDGEPAPVDPIEDGTLLRPSRGPVDPAPPVEHTEVRPSTRRAASGRIAAPADTTRAALVPGDAPREIYRPRVAEPVIVARAAPTRAPGEGGAAPDAEAARRRERRRRRRLIVLAVIVGAVVVVAAAGIVVLLAL